MVNTVETTYLPGAIYSDAEPPWYTELNLGGREIKFKIDAGADVSVISRKRYHELGLCLNFIRPTLCSAVLVEPWHARDSLSQSPEYEIDHTHFAFLS